MNKILVIPQAQSQALALINILQPILETDVYLLPVGDKINNYISHVSNPIIIVSFDMRDANALFWEKIRSDLLNPVIILGNMNNQSFYEENPAFKYAQRYHHYLQWPWRIVDIITSIETVSPIYDEQSRAMLYEKYSDKYMFGRVYWLLYHDLKLADKGRDMTILIDTNKVALKINNNELENLIAKIIVARKQNQKDIVLALKSQAIDLIHKLQKQRHQ